MVVKIVELAVFEAEAATADAPVKPVAGPLELGDARVELFPDRAADRLPVLSRGRPAVRQARELLLDLRQPQPQLLRNQDEAQPADVAAQEPALIAAGADRFDQPLSS